LNAVCLLFGPFLTDVSWKEFLISYRGADKSLARPDWKNTWKVTIYLPTRRSLLPWRTVWTDKTSEFF